MTIYDGRESFYQWDLNQKITSNTLDVGDEIHFSNTKQPNALMVKAYMLDGRVVADVPNILLQNAYPIKVWKYQYGESSAQTIEEHIFKVQQRPKPGEYVYSETELYELRRTTERLVSEALVAETAESERKIAESNRISNENARFIAEEKRIDSEAIRDTAETARITAERLRLDAESARQTAEQERQSAETLRQIAFEQSYNNMANALKGTASGEVVRVDDVSPIAHSAKVKVRSKNLLDLNLFIVANTTTHYTVSGNELTVTGYHISQYLDCVSGGKTYTLSFVSERTGDTGGGVSVEYYDTTGKYISGFYTTDTLSAVKTFTLPNNATRIKVFLYGTKISTGVDSATYSNIMLEEGDTATEYTPYIDPTTATVMRYGVDETDNPQTYVPSADGTFDVASLSPTMTLVTDTDGVTIEAEYNRDINIVINDILQRITN